ncbi:hypothetical protein BJV74DRAFT_172223 [Russula compacta]|nr:hypothetical protein BJV74DRAFT_172223 [Russula compacta]
MFPPAKIFINRVGREHIRKHGHNLLDRSANPTALQKLAYQVHRGTLTLARASRRSLSLSLSPAPHSTDSHDLTTDNNQLFLWDISALPLGVYVIAQDLNVPLNVQPQLFCLSSLLSRRRWYVLSARGIVAGKGGVRFFGILSTTLISISLMPQFCEIYKHRAVIGISLAFMAIDLLGGLSSILSLVFKHQVDVLAAVAYGIVTVMDGLVIVLAMILNPRRRAWGVGNSGHTTVLVMVAH